VLELPDAGHYPQEDAAEQVIPAVRDLLATPQP
jgi:pimeloyl-ACP methyl ester carboxylesterase